MTVPKLVSAPAEFITLPETKARLNIWHSDDDAALAGLITAAIAWMDGWGGKLGRCIATQNWISDFSGFYDTALPFPDLSALSVEYLDPQNQWQALPASNFEFGNTNLSSWLSFKSGFVPPALLDVCEPVRITGTYGFETIPASLKTAAIMLVGHWHKNSEGQEEIPPGVMALVGSLQRRGS